MRFLTALAAVAAVTLPFSVPADAQTKIKLEEVAGGLTHPLAMVTIPDGSGRKAVIEQTGLVRVERRLVPHLVTRHPAPGRRLGRGGAWRRDRRSG